ncbi:MAG TPA: M48 family metalloprotease, partial [Solirubrobacteraceae bacterium]
FFGGGMYDSDDDNGPGLLPLILISLLVYVISFFLIQTLSRYREFAADRASALITGRPSALISALMKLDSGMAKIPQQDLRTAEGMAAFFIVPPKVGQSLTNLFSTHPPMEKRIAALERLEAQLQGTAGSAIAA